MPICINLGIFHVPVTTYLSYTVTGTSESSSFEIQVMRTELFWVAFKSIFPTSFFSKEDFLYQILSPGFCWCFFGKVKWRFWFIHLCRTITFEHFAVFNRIAFMVNFLRSGIAHLLSRRAVQAMTVFGFFLRFPPKDFIGSIRSFSLWYLAPLKTLGCIFGTKQKYKVNSHHVTRCKTTWFWSANYPSEKQLSASVFHFESDLCMMTITVFEQ